MIEHAQQEHGGRIYGDAVAHSFGLRNVPSLATRSLRKSQIAVNRLSIGPQQIGMSPQIPVEDTFIVAMYLTEVGYHELWSAGKPLFTQGYAPYGIRIVNLSWECSAYVACPHETLVFYVPRAVLNEFTDEAGGRRVVDLACTPGIIDPVLVQLGSLLLPALERPKEAPALFVDHIALAICAHLAHTYGGFRRPAAMPRGGLSPAVAQRAKDFLASRVGDDVKLADVAAACGLSRGHFLRAFKVSTGMTPHRWLQHYRVETAKHLLRDGASEIAQIALTCGFVDQSHFTRVFTRIVGVSPGAWRRHWRN